MEIGKIGEKENNRGFGRCIIEKNNKVRCVFDCDNPFSWADSAPSHTWNSHQCGRNQRGS
jgi:hypothetical protein